MTSRNTLTAQYHDRNEAENRKLAAGAPQARAHSKAINEITKLASVDLIAMLRTHADELDAVHPSPTKARTLREIAGKLEINHTDTNAWAALDHFRYEAHKSASHLEGLASQYPAAVPAD